jgi:hypothetical protein
MKEVLSSDRRLHKAEVSLAPTENVSWRPVTGYWRDLGEAHQGRSLRARGLFPRFVDDDGNALQAA